MVNTPFTVRTADPDTSFTNSGENGVAVGGINHVARASIAEVFNRFGVLTLVSPAQPGSPASANHTQPASVVIVALLILLPLDIVEMNNVSRSDVRCIT